LLCFQIDGGIFAATVNFELEVQTIAFVQSAETGAFNGADVHKGIGLTIIALNEAKALHRVEKLHRTTGAFAGKLTLGAAITAAKAACAGFTRFARAAVDNGEGFTVDLQVSRRNLASTIHQREAERLTFSKTGQARLLNGTDVNEHIFAAIITHNKAEALLSVEKLYNASAFANDLGRHSAATAAAATETAAAAAITAAEAATVTTAKATAITATKTAPVATKTTAAIARTTRFGESATKAIFTKTIALISAASAATSIKTHALSVTFASSK
jgi:hypothetical protein